MTRLRALGEVAVAHLVARPQVAGPLGRGRAVHLARDERDRLRRAQRIRPEAPDQVGREAGDVHRRMMVKLPESRSSPANLRPRMAPVRSLLAVVLALVACGRRRGARRGPGAPSGRDDRPGVSAAGVDLSGTTLTIAKDRLNALLTTKLQRDVIVHAPGEDAAPEGRRREAHLRRLEDRAPRAVRRPQAPGGADRRRRPGAEPREAAGPHVRPVGRGRRRARSRATRRSASPSATSTARGRRPARRSTPRRWRRRSTRRSISRARSRVLRPERTKRLAAAVNANDLGQGLRDDPHRRPRQLPPARLQEPEVLEVLPDRRRPGRPRHAAGRVLDRQQAGQPGLARPELRVGRQPPGPGHPRRGAEQPAQGALARDRRRRRHPRHRPRTGRSARARRTAASGCTSPTSRTCTRGSPSARKVLIK